jgi:4-hydroxybenzoate polyprenyltransferase
VTTPANNLKTQLSNIVHFFVSSSLFLALNSVLVVYFSAILYEVKVPPTILLLAFFTTIAVYSLNKLTDRTEDNINKPNQTTKIQSRFITPTIVCYAIALSIAFTKGYIVFLVLLIPLLIGFVYSVKLFKPLPRFKLLNIKSVLVTFSWAFTGALLPTLTDTTIATEKILLVFLYLFIQIFVNAILFDILDMRGDKAINAKTMPLRFGKKKATYFLCIVNSLLFLWLGFCFTAGLFTKYLPVIMFGMIYSYGLIWYFTKNENKRFHAEIIADGEWIPIVIFLWLIAR